MMKSKSFNAVRKSIIVRLVRRFQELPEPQMEVTTQEIEFKWTMWIVENMELTPSPSNVSRRFRELREEWRNEERYPGENESMLRSQAGIIEVARLSYSPLKVSLTQEISFTEEDCAFIDPEENEEAVA